MPSNLSFPLLGLLAGLLFAAVPARAGDAQAEETARKQQLADYRLALDVLARIESEYPDPVSRKDLIGACLNGALTSLHPSNQYSAGPDEREALAGEDGRAGVGIEFDNRLGLPRVTYVRTGSPAGRAGITTEDFILAIDGATAEGLSADRVHRRLLGPAGSKVSLEVRAKGSLEPRTLELERERYRPRPMQWRDLGDGVVYLSPADFDQDYVDALVQVFERQRTDGARLKGLVLDLRDHPGGTLHGSVATAAAFLEENAPVLEVRGKGPDTTFLTEAHSRFFVRPGTIAFAGWPAWLRTVPLAVVVDRNTGSGAEAVAGTLQESGRAFVVGAPTSGKGLIHSIRPVSAEAELKLVAGKMYTPKGRAIEEGIWPDRIVDAGARGPEPSADAVIGQAKRWLLERKR